MCLPMRDDYFECLHHKKEVRHMLAAARASPERRDGATWFDPCSLHRSHTVCADCDDQGAREQNGWRRPSLTTGRIERQRVQTVEDCARGSIA